MQAGVVRFVGVFFLILSDYYLREERLLEMVCDFY